MKRASVAIAVAVPLLVAALAFVPERVWPAPKAPAAGTENAPIPAAPAVAPAPAVDQGPLFDEGSLAPYFSEGKLAAAHARFVAGQYADAYRLFTAADDGSPQVAWVRALSALVSNQPKEAEKILRKLGKRLPALRDRIDYHLGIARERLEDWDGAAKAYRRVPEGSGRKDDARLAEARMEREAGRPEKALATLAPLFDRRPPGWGNDYGASALLLASEIQAKQGKKDEARALLWRIWAEHPLSAQAEDARQRAEATKGPGPSLAQSVANAVGYLDAQRNREGIEKLEKLLPRLQLPDPTACEGRFALGRGYRKQREHSKAIPMLEEVVARCTDRGVRAKALYILGQSTSIVAVDKAPSVYQTLANDYPDHSFADDALLFLAELRMRADDWKGAREALQLLVDRYPAGDYRADALFRLFWIDREHKHLKRGLENLRILERDYANAPDSGELERSLYWQGRTLVSLRRKTEAGATWEKLVREHPASYYAMLARGRLAQLEPSRARRVEAEIPEPPAESPPLALHAGALLPDPHFAAAVELIKLGFPRQATDELIRIDRKAARERAGGSPEPVLVVAWMLEHVDARRAAHQIARTELRELLRGPPSGEANAHFRIAYPLAYRDLIERHGNSYGVPPDLMQALMREESSLDPEVVSWAGAIGLTQLMPSTASAVAKGLKLGRVTPGQLRDPDLNVRLGTAYLGQLLKRWKGNPALAAASYNAGPGAVARWLADRRDLEMDEFVEEIPVEETRNYVKRVLKSFNAYRLTYGAGNERFLALVPARADPR